MSRRLVLLAVLAASAAFAQGRRRGMQADSPPSPGKTESEKRILATLEEVAAKGETYLSVPPSDGRLLRLLAEAINARTVVEIGTSTGYSGLWFCLALDKTGGKLTTFEYDQGRAGMARAHFEKAGVARLVNVIEGDAHQNVKQLKGPLDLVFVDADKEGYLDYLDKLLPLVRPGGLILAHNSNSAPEYVRRVTGNADLETVFYGGDLAVTLKKR